MSRMLGSQSLVLATAMAVSAGTVILLDQLFRVKYYPTTTTTTHLCSSKQNPILKSCLSSAGKNKDRAKKKKKRVHFAADVKVSSGNGERYRREQRKSHNNSCGNEIKRGMPGNRVALYTGILKDRVQRMEFSY